MSEHQLLQPNNEHYLYSDKPNFTMENVYIEHKAKPKDLVFSALGPILKRLLGPYLEDPVTPQWGTSYYRMYGGTGYNPGSSSSSSTTTYSDNFIITGSKFKHQKYYHNAIKKAHLTASPSIYIPK